MGTGQSINHIKIHREELQKCACRVSLGASFEIGQLIDGLEIKEDIYIPINEPGEIAFEKWIDNARLRGQQEKIAILERFRTFAYSDEGYRFRHQFALLYMEDFKKTLKGQNPITTDFGKLEESVSKKIKLTYHILAIGKFIYELIKKVSE